jgi:F0F1-type ATP synthase membrane subunit b/b'
VKSSAHTETVEGTTESASRRRRFRLGKRSFDAELAQLDGLVSAVDELASDTHASAYGSDMSASALAARAALADLDNHAEVTEADSLDITSSATTPITVESTPVRIPQPQQAAPVSDAHMLAGIDPTLLTARQLATQLDTDIAEAHAPVMPAPQPTIATPAPESVARRAGMLVDVSRIIQTLEDEAESAKHRIDMEIRNAREEADSLLDRANADAQRIRDHAQQQARVLLGEVEEIISEAQQTGQDILRRAETDAEGVREQALIALDQAQDEARTIIEVARREGESILAEQRRLATVRAQEALREQDRLKDQIRRLEERRRQVLESLEAQISQLSQLIPNAAGIGTNVVDFPGGQSRTQ